jgi:hypothetical protein
VRRKHRGPAVELPPAHKAPGALSALSAYVYGALEIEPRTAEATPAVVALRDLRAQHQEDPRSPSQALSEAYNLLTSHDALDDFLRWKVGPGSGCAGHWPTDRALPRAI